MNHNAWVICDTGDECISNGHNLSLEEARETVDQDIAAMVSGDIPSEPGDVTRYEIRDDDGNVIEAWEHCADWES